MANQTFAKLEAEYCPPLEGPLLSAILSDFDLHDPQSVQNARATLDPLKESALLEEQIGFDASGTGGSHIGAVEGDSRAESLPDTCGGSLSRDTDLTSLSNGLLSLDLETDTNGHDVVTSGMEDEEYLQSFDEETKIRLLTEITEGKVNQYTIKHTLQKCNGEWTPTLNLLLNHVYFEEAGTEENGGKVSVKGVDAFAEENMIKRGRKGKAKDRRLKDFSSSRSTSLPVSPVSPVSDIPQQANRWTTAGQDIDFIVNRTGLPSASVSSAYYRSGATLPKAIGTLLRADINKKTAVDSNDETITANARELGFEFPGIAPDYLTALIRLTHPSTASAHELAKALTKSSQDAHPVGLQIITNYQPPTGVEMDALTRPGSKRSQRAGVTIETSFSNDGDVAAQANRYATARSMAFAQAQAAYRRAKSDRLMGGAAAYYGQVSRDYAARSFQARAAVADDLAGSQSSASQLDLHGVDVLNAVRIAQDKVEKWWQSMGEDRVNGRVGAEGRQSGYTIVVGLGKHSEGGKSKIGPAVKKMLREAGWRFEDGGATILVKGRVKR